MKRRQFVQLGALSAMTTAVPSLGCAGLEIREEPDGPAPPATGVTPPDESALRYGREPRVFTGDGRSFAIATSRHEISILDANDRRIATLGARDRAPTSSPADLNAPVSAVWDETRKRLFVLERGSERITVFDGDGRALGVLTRTSRGADLATDGRNALFVAASSAHVIEVYDKTGSSLGTVGRFGTDERGLNGPTSVAYALDRTLHVVDSGSHRVKVFTTDGRFVRSYGDALVGPHAIRIDAEGRAWVADMFDRVVVVFETGSGRELARFTPRMDGAPATPIALTPRADGSIYTALQRAA